MPPRSIDKRTEQLQALLTDYLRRYALDKTRRNVTQQLNQLFRTTGRRHPAELTETDLAHWITGAGQPIANNTARQRLSTARTFLAWCQRTGLVTVDRSVHIDHLKSQYPKMYGKAQALHPARFLTKDEAYGRLLAACQDGTWTGSRDQIAIRLGLLGLRSREVCSLRWNNLLPDGRLRWVGKGRKDRTVTPGPTMTALLQRWKKHYETQLGHRVNDEPVICCLVRGAQRHGGPARLDYGAPMQPRTFFEVVQKRALAAGLGYVAPHDLRRTTAAILHNDKTPDGGHRFDLEDIRQVLDHADPATTQRSYLQQLDTETKDRAGAVLD